MSQLLTINLAKGPGTPWGFRLQGGKDFAQPLCIQKVNVGSVAAQAGLLAGDAIVSIGNEDALTLRHKEAQDAIVRAGNCFPMVIQRGSITWKPQVTALAQPKKTTQGPVLTQTSLAKKPLEEPRICKGFNAKPKGFGEVNGTPITVSAYNSPINLYNEENIAEALSSQSEVLGKGCLGVNFKKHDKALEESDVYRMVHEMDKGPKTPTAGPASPAVYHSPQPAPLTPSEMIGTPEIPVQGASFRILEKYLTNDEQGVSKLPSSSPAATGGGHQLSSGQNVCAECGRLIVGVFVRIRGKNLHADCFKCNTCGSSLKNVGYYNINDKMYCDVHAKQAAKHNPPAPNMEPVTVKPGSAVPSGAFPAAVAKSSPLSLPSVASAPVAPGGSSANPNAFGAPSGGLNVRSHIPKKGPAPVVASAPGPAPAPVFIPAPAPAFTPAPVPAFTPAPAPVFTPPKPVVPAVQPAPSKPAFGGISMPKPTPLPDLGGLSVGPKAPGMGGKGMSSQRTAPKRGRGIMTPAHASRIPICSGCNIQIRGPFVTALGKNWCPDHFHCATGTCGKPLIEIGFVEEQGRLHCEDCYEKFLAPTCGKCEKRIKGDCLNAVGKQFHPECFCCAYCGKVFGSGAFYLEDGLPYCETDWNDLFTTKCVGCGFPIEAGDRWVEALNNNYHSQCFKCSKCHKNLEGQSFFAKGGKPFCKSHAQRGF